MQAGRSGRRIDEEDEEAAVEARAVDAHQAQGDGREAAVLQEHQAASGAPQAGNKPVDLHQQLLTTFCEKTNEAIKRKTA